MNFLNIRQNVGAGLVRAGKLILPGSPEFGGQGIIHDINFDNPIKAELFRKGEKIAEARTKNGVTVVGKNYMMDCMFGAATPVAQVDPWYIGLINNTPTPTLSENDTMDSHSGWAELTDYAGDRKAWDDADSASKIKGTNTVSTFVFNATVTVYGILVCSASTGSTSSVILWATGAFDSTLDAVSSDELKVTYGVRM